MILVVSKQIGVWYNNNYICKDFVFIYVLARNVFMNKWIYGLTIYKEVPVIVQQSSLIYYWFSFRAAIAAIGGMYEKLGRMVGRSYEETIQVLIKSLKNSEVHGQNRLQDENIFIIKNAYIQITLI